MIGIIGTGSMGAAIAEGLLAADSEVMVFNRTRERAVPLERLGARIANSAAEALTACEATIIVLPDASSTREVLLEPSTAAVLDGSKVLSVAHTTADEIIGLAAEVEQHGGRLSEVNVTVYPAPVRARRPLQCWST